ncbi:MAG: hypothetical protein ACP5VE_01555 [Chthonomonadales bacterium]
MAEQGSSFWWRMAAAVAAFVIQLPALGQVIIGANFTGSSVGISGYIPPDTMGAIGPNAFVEFINGRYRVYSRSGAVLASTTLNAFWTNAGVSSSSSFDPRVLYDAGSGRWFAAAADNPGTASSRFLLAVSNSSDPTAGWKAFSIAADPLSTRWADFPTLGVNGSGVYLAANMFKFDNTSPLTTVIAVDKASLVSGTLTNVSFTNLDPNTTGFSIQPVHDLDGGGTPEYLYSDYNTPAGTFKQSTITGSGAGNTLNTTDHLISVAAFNGPPLGVQPGGPNNVDTGDTRFSSSVVKVNGKIWGVQSVTANGRAALRWFRINAATDAVEETGIIGDPNHDYYYGSIAVNTSGTVVIGYSRSGASEFISSYASVGSYNGTTTTFGSPLLLKSGTASYQILDGSGSNRWGDYSATTIDPLDPTHFWTIQEWASGSSSWSTQITELITGPGAVPVSAFQSSLIGAVIAGWWLRAKRSGETRRRKRQCGSA